jgi:hypothetical protein
MPNTMGSAVNVVIAALLFMLLQLAVAVAIVAGLVYVVKLVWFA